MVEDAQIIDAYPHIHVHKLFLSDNLHCSFYPFACQKIFL